MTRLEPNLKNAYMYTTKRNNMYPSTIISCMPEQAKLSCLPWYINKVEITTLFDKRTIMMIISFDMCSMENFLHVQNY